jgi:hypothetical protein
MRRRSPNINGVEHLAGNNAFAVLGVGAQAIALPPNESEGVREVNVRGHGLDTPLVTAMTRTLIRVYPVTKGVPRIRRPNDTQRGQ